MEGALPPPRQSAYGINVRRRRRRALALITQFRASEIRIP
jgi:hypothetical protein